MMLDCWFLLLIRRCSLITSKPTMIFRGFLLMFLLFSSIPVHSSTPMFLCFSLICGSIPYAARTCCKTNRSCCDAYQSWLEPLIGPEVILGEMAKTFLELKAMYSPSKSQRMVNSTRSREPRKKT